MLNLKSLALSALVLTTVNFNAQAFDVNAGERHYVQVTKKGDKVNFQECFRGEGCVRDIGPKKYYSIKKLQDQRIIEGWQVAGAVVSDVAIIAGASIGGGMALSAALGTSSSAFGSMVGGLAGGFLGFGAGFVGGTVASYSIDILNPYEQYMQSDAIEDNIILDENVKLKNIEKFISRLEVVLNKM